MISADILMAILVIGFTVLVMWLIKRFVDWDVDRAVQRKLARLVSQDCGDQGGMPEPVESHHVRPKAPQIGCGLPVGDERPAFLKRTIGDQAALRKKFGR